MVSLENLMRFLSLLFVLLYSGVMTRLIRYLSFDFECIGFDDV